jgi:hypothetical protein
MQANPTCSINDRAIELKADTLQFVDLHWLVHVQSFTGTCSKYLKSDSRSRATHGIFCNNEYLYRRSDIDISTMPQHVAVGLPIAPFIHFLFFHVYLTCIDLPLLMAAIPDLERVSRGQDRKNSIRDYE